MIESTTADTATEALSIGDVSKIYNIPVHTIRYWEQEFGEYLNPSRTSGRQRRYSDEEIERICSIKSFLWDKGYSIRAAKRILLSQLAPIIEASNLANLPSFAPTTMSLV